MKAIYYTTSEIMTIFGWQSNTTIQRKRDSGFIPPPDLPGRPNKWLKCKIDDIINAPNPGAGNQNNDSL